MSPRAQSRGLFMGEVNYIKHLNKFFQLITKDSRLNTTHISLYMALFHCWNNARFSKEFYINRNEIMIISKIGSKGTYHKCLKELHYWKYLEYIPSYNPTKGSKIRMFHFQKSSTYSGTASEQVPNNLQTGSEQVAGPYTNNSKSNKQYKTTIKGKPKNKNESIQFFKKKKWPEYQAIKFFNHYEANGWKLGGKAKIENWQAAAENWMIRFRENEKNKTPPVQNRDNLHTPKNKNYDEPL